MDRRPPNNRGSLRRSFRPYQAPATAPLPPHSRSSPSARFFDDELVESRHLLSLQQEVFLSLSVCLSVCLSVSVRLALLFNFFSFSVCLSVSLSNFFLRGLSVGQSVGPLFSSRFLLYPVSFSPFFLSVFNAIF